MITVDPIPTLLLSLAVIIAAAKLGGHVAAKMGQPPVLGELLAGVVMGNLALVGFGGFEYLKTNTAIDMLARLGVILLLFQVGLEILQLARSAHQAEDTRVGVDHALRRGRDRWRPVDVEGDDVPAHSLERDVGYRPEREAAA